MGKPNGSCCRASKRARLFTYPTEVLNDAICDDQQKEGLLHAMRGLSYENRDDQEEAPPIDGQAVALHSIVGPGTPLFRSLKEITGNSSWVQLFAETRTPRRIIVNKMADARKKGSAFTWHMDGAQGETVISCVLTLFEGGWCIHTG